MLSLSLNKVYIKCIGKSIIFNLFIFPIFHLEEIMDTPQILSKVNHEDICLIDSGTTHAIFKDMKYFSHLLKRKASVTTISGNSKLIEGSGRATIFLPKGTKLVIEDALFSSKSPRNLLSFKDIRRNGYHVETLNEMNIEYLGITKSVSGQKYVLEKLPTLSSGLYYAEISTIEAHSIVNQKFTDPNVFVLWHDRMGHPGSIMMRRILENSTGHPLKNLKILTNDEFTCAACYQGKLIARPSSLKVGIESPGFLDRIHGDICGPIHPPSGTFRYFMVLIDASSIWSHVCLLPSHNLAFAKLLAQII